MMVPSMLVKSSGRAEVSSTTKMAPFMMVNGSRTRDQVLEKCYSKTARSMTVSGTLTRFTEKESTFRAMAIGTMATSTMG